MSVEPPRSSGQETRRRLEEEDARTASAYGRENTAFLPPDFEGLRNEGEARSLQEARRGVTRSEKTDEQVLEAVTLAALGRLPTKEEKRATLAVFGTAQDRKAAWVGLAKAYAASDEGKKHAGASNKSAIVTEVNLSAPAIVGGSGVPHFPARWDKRARPRRSTGGQEPSS